MDRRVGHPNEIANMIVDIFTTIASLHSQVNEYICYDKNYGFWEETKQHPLERTCDRLPFVLVIIKSLCTMLAKENPDWASLSITIATAGRKPFFFHGSRKDKIEATLDSLVEECELCTKAICAEENRFNEAGILGKWSLVGVDDLCRKSVHAEYQASFMQSEYRRTGIGPAAFNRDLMGHSLSGILNLS